MCTFQAFFAGLSGAAGVVLASTIQLGCYEQCKKILHGFRPKLLESAAVGVHSRGVSVGCLCPELQVCVRE